VVRVLDANTVKLKRGGLVTFAAVGSPSGYNQQDFSFPECMTKSPSSKTRNLLPAKSRVGVYYVNTYRVDGNKPRSALVVTDKEELLVNLELVKSGFARPVSRGSEEVEQALGVQFIKELREMQQQAKDAGAGFYARCEKSDSSITASEDQFEPLDYTVETKWGDDGGKQVIVNRKDNDIKAKMPANPGDTKGCSDFEYYEDALRWYEAYFPYYGDVAKLDRDGDGVPCPGLPHTQNQDRYRMKVPMVQK